jgi:hypothetical protein
MNPLINLDHVWDTPTKTAEWRAKLPNHANDAEADP